MDIFKIYNGIINKIIPYYGYMRIYYEKKNYYEWNSSTLFKWL